MKWKKLYRESTSPDFIDVERLRKEIEEVLQETTDEWPDGYMKDCADEYMDDYLDDAVGGAVTSFNRLVHKADTSMSGNFKDIKYDWNGFHDEYPHGASLKEVVEMIDSGEDNEITREFKDWAVDWYFEAFGTFGLTYNWTNFMEEITYEDEEDDEQ